MISSISSSCMISVFVNPVPPSRLGLHRGKKFCNWVIELGNLKILLMHWWISTFSNSFDNPFSSAHCENKTEGYIVRAAVKKCPSTILHPYTAFLTIGRIIITQTCIFFALIDNSYVKSNSLWILFKADLSGPLSLFSGVDVFIDGEKWSIIEVVFSSFSISSYLGFFATTSSSLSGFLVLILLLLHWRTWMNLK